MKTNHAATDLISSYQDYMKSLARNIHRKLPGHVDYNDIVGYGQIGLAQAASRYDYTCGVSFETYSYYRIRGAIFDGLRKMSGAPSSVCRWAGTQSTVDQVSIDMQAQPPASDHPGALADHLSESIRKLGLVFTLANLPENSCPEPADELTPAMMAQTHELKARMTAAMRSLSPDEATVIDGLYFKGLTMTEIALRLGKNKSTISRIHAKALTNLRSAMDRKVA